MRVLETAFFDLRLAVRQLRKSPGFAVIAIVILGLGLGGSASIFSVVNAVLLHAVPYADPAKLVVVFEHDIDPGSGRASISYLDYEDWQSQSRTLAHLAIARETQFNLSGGTPLESARIDGAFCSSSLFTVLGNRPLMGRLLTPSDDRPGAPRVAVIGYSLWQDRFAGAADILSRHVRLDGDEYAIAGVMPKGFRYPRTGSQVWIAAGRAISDAARTRRGWRQFHGVGRLAPGMGVDQARIELSAIAQRIKRSNPGVPLASGAEVLPFQEFATGHFRAAVLILFGAVGCVLLIACANVANLLLARGAQRQRELAIRAAVGASRGRMVQQLLTESSCLAFAGGTLGLLIASFAIAALSRVIPSLIDRGPIQPAGDIRIDWSVFLFTFAVAALSGLVVGIIPALRSSRRNLNVELRDNSRSVTAGRGQRLLRNSLVSAEMAVSLVLLVGAGLLLRSFLSIRSVRPGVRTDHVLTAGFSLDASRYPDGRSVRAFTERLQQKLTTLPGVTAAALSSCLPIDGSCGDQFFAIDGHPLPPGKMLDANNWAVTRDFFRAAGVPILRGRSFTAQDEDLALSKSARYTAIISNSMARQFWPGENPIGQTFHFGDSADDPRWEVVGICGDVMTGLDQQADPAYFVPVASWRMLYAVVATTVTPETLSKPVRQTIATLDPDIPAFQIRSMREVSNASTSDRRFSAVLVGLFAGAAVLLAAIGSYGVLSFLVLQRRAEIGIRMVLGATRSEVQRMVIGQGLGPVFAGLIVGLGVAMAVPRLLSSLLFGASKADPLIFVGACVLLLLVATLACLVPAWRAGSVEPSAALRDS